MKLLGKVNAHGNKTRLASAVPAKRQKLLGESAKPLSDFIDTKLPGADRSLIAQHLPWLHYEGDEKGYGQYTLTWKDPHTGAHISQRYDREGNFLKDGYTYAINTDEISNNADFHNTLVQKFVALAIGDGGADGAVVAAWQADTVLAQGTRGRDVAVHASNDNFARRAA